MMRRGAAGLLAGLLLGFLAAVATPMATSRTGCALAAASSHVAVVAEHSDGAVVTRCVTFSGTSIGAAQAMQLASQAGLEYATVSYGSLGQAVCQIDHEPQSFPPGCWTTTSPYWAMFVWHPGAGWSLAAGGLSSVTLAAGDALGWHYIPQSGSGGGPPPSPVGVCPSASPPPTPTAGSSSAGAAEPHPSTSGPSPLSSPSLGVATPSPPTARPEASAARRAAGTEPSGWMVWLGATVIAGGLSGLAAARLIGLRKHW